MTIEIQNLKSASDLATQIATDQKKDETAGLGLSSSLMKDSNPQKSLTSYTISDILQGVPLYKPTGATADTFNQELSKELEDLRTEKLYHEDGRLNPFDVFKGDAKSKSFKGGFTTGATTAVADGAANTLPATGNPAAFTGDLMEHPRDLGMTNGRLDTSLLVDADGKGNKMWKTAADFYKKMVAAAGDSANLAIGNTYRTYERQVSMKAEKGRMAATPGKSNHGWGMAIDFGFGSSEGSSGFKWLTQNAWQYHFHWLNERTKTPYEPWHWEFDPWGEASGKLRTGPP